MSETPAVNPWANISRQEMPQQLITSDTYAQPTVPEAPAPVADPDAALTIIQAPTSAVAPLSVLPAHQPNSLSVVGREAKATHRFGESTFTYKRQGDSVDFSKNPWTADKELRRMVIKTNENSYVFAGNNAYRLDKDGNAYAFGDGTPNGGWMFEVDEEFPIFELGEKLPAEFGDEVITRVDVLFAQNDQSKTPNEVEQQIAKVEAQLNLPDQAEIISVRETIAAVEAKAANQVAQPSAPDNDAAPDIDDTQEQPAAKEKGRKARAERRKAKKEAASEARTDKNNARGGKLSRVLGAVAASSVLNAYAYTNYVAGMTQYELVTDEPQSDVEPQVVPEPAPEPAPTTVLAAPAVAAAPVRQPAMPNAAPEPAPTDTPATPAKSMRPPTRQQKALRKTKEVAVSGAAKLAEKAKEARIVRGLGAKAIAQVGNARSFAQDVKAVRETRRKDDDEASAS